MCSMNYHQMDPEDIDRIFQILYQQPRTYPESLAVQSAAAYIQAIIDNYKPSESKEAKGEWNEESILGLVERYLRYLIDSTSPQPHIPDHYQSYYQREPNIFDPYLCEVMHYLGTLYSEYGYVNKSIDTFDELFCYCKRFYGIVRVGKDRFNQWSVDSAKARMLRATMIDLIPGYYGRRMSERLRAFYLIFMEAYETFEKKEESYCDAVDQIINLKDSRNSIIKEEANILLACEKWRLQAYNHALYALLGLTPSAFCYFFPPNVHLKFSDKLYSSLLTHFAHFDRVYILAPLFQFQLRRGSEFWECYRSTITFKLENQTQRERYSRTYGFHHPPRQLEYQYSNEHGQWRHNNINVIYNKSGRLLAHHRFDTLEDILQFYRTADENNLLDVDEWLYQEYVMMSFLDLLDALLTEAKFDPKDKRSKMFCEDVRDHDKQAKRWRKATWIHERKRRNN